MKPVWIVVLVLAPLGVAFLWMEANRDEGMTSSRSSGTDAETRRRLDRLESELTRMGDDQDRLREELRRLRLAVQESFAEAGTGGETKGGGPRSLLMRYQQSFQSGGSGSEYFRLGVEAHAELLLDDITALVLDGKQLPAFRMALLRMLGNPKFRGTRKVLETLTQAARIEAPAGISRAAVTALAQIGGNEVAQILEGLWPDLPSPASRRNALNVIRAHAGDQASAAFQRLLGYAKDDAERIHIVKRAPATDEQALMQLFRNAFRHGKPVRSAVAQRLRRIPTKAARRLVEDFLEVERDPDVRKILEEARKPKIPDWHAMQATGAPDAKPPNRDHQKAWASLRGNMGIQWLELTYPKPITAQMIRIFEVYNAGAVARVEVVNSNGQRTTVWSGTDPTKEPGVFEVRFSPVPRVVRVRVVLDTNRKSGWNEIDAVELVGSRDRAWATSAVASSTYGQ